MAQTGIQLALQSVFLARPRSLADLEGVPRTLQHMKVNQTLRR